MVNFGDGAVAADHVVGEARLEVLGVWGSEVLSAHAGNEEKDVGSPSIFLICSAVSLIERAWMLSWRCSTLRPLRMGRRGQLMSKTWKERKEQRTR